MPRTKIIAAYARFEDGMPVLDDDGNQVWVEQQTVPYTADEEAAADAEEASWTAQTRLREIDAKLLELDRKLPRSIEELITEGGYLFPVKQEKQALRRERLDEVQTITKTDHN